MDERNFREQEVPCADRSGLVAAPAETFKGWNVNIQPMDYGYTVSVGCKSFAIESADKLLDKLRVYLANPGEASANYMNKTFTLD